MKKVFVVLGLIIFFIIFQIFYKKDEFKKTATVVLPTKTVVFSPFLQKEKKSLFVPYWSIGQEYIESNEYDRLIYFGIATDANGINKNEKGYQNISQFASLTDNHKEKYIVLRMVDSKSNFSILQNNDLQQKIIEDTVAIAVKNQFSGVVLDLEISSLPFSSIVDPMNRFALLMQKALVENRLRFSILLFGDTFYRIRPYDVAFLSQKADEIMVMAYDFSKATSDPGPNFPFFGQNEFGYDFQIMTTDYLNVVSLSKLTIVFGMFGYDWKTDENGKGTQQAQSHSYLEMKKLFLDSCLFAHCVVTYNSNQSEETKVTYTDSNGDSHVVWFEDMESVGKKEAFLKEKGIFSTAFWAYSYF